MSVCVSVCVCVCMSVRVSECIKLIWLNTDADFKQFAQILNTDILNTSDIRHNILDT